MRHLELERWAQRRSFLHGRHPAALAAASVAVLISVALVHGGNLLGLALHLSVALAALAAANLPFGGLLARAMVVLPFSGLFAAMRAALGDTEQAVALVVKSYTSAVLVLTLVGVLGLPRLLYALGTLGMPRQLVLIAQFLYRYLIVLGGEAQGMLRAARCRLGGADREATFAAASGGVSVLFGRAYGRAERIHGAMLARGFDGQMRELRTERFTASDALLIVAALTVLLTHLLWR